jgi:hypothetical protein
MVGRSSLGGRPMLDSFRPLSLSPRTRGLGHLNPAGGPARRVGARWMPCSPCRGVACMVTELLGPMRPGDTGHTPCLRAMGRGLVCLGLLVGFGMMLQWLMRKPPMAFVYWGIVVLVVGIGLSLQFGDEEWEGVPESFGDIGLIFIGLGLRFILPQSPRMQAAWQPGSGSSVVALHVSSDRPELGWPA